MGGVSPISAQEIVAWQQLRRVKLSQFELDMIEDFDRVAIESANKK